jgi:hypothetical protein
MTSVNQSTNVLPSDTHSSLGGNASAYQEKIMGGAQQRGGQGHGFEGKSIAPGVAEVSSYKGGRNKRRQTKKRRQSKKNQRKSRKQRKSRR